MMPNQTSSDPSVEAILAALVDVVFRDGRAELSRSAGRRGVLHLQIELVLGDSGKPLESNGRLFFSEKRHMKDNFS